ncbi:MAG: hypothetical protein WCT10_03610 [Patescibacteria group bacterium]|jgi:hypothetical protein
MPTSSLGRLKKSKNYPFPILFARSTSWLFWLTAAAIFSWWIYILAISSGSSTVKSIKKNISGPPKLIEYSITDPLIAVDVYRVPIRTLFPIANLVENSRLCRKAQTEEYFRKLIQTFAQEDGQVYAFRYLGDVSDNGLLPIVVIPNRPQYRNLTAFKKDFNVCVSGGRYPYEVTENWLMYMEDCPAHDRRSQNIAGCDLIRSELTKNNNLKLIK